MPNVILTAEQRGDLKAAEAWLAKIDDPKSALDVQSRRASLLARQGQMAQARELIRRMPERNDEEARAKVLAEVQLLREFKRWREAIEVMTAANKRFPDDADLLYEQAMLEDKLDHHAEMERLLQRVIQLKPDNPHAHNALGYSLADRSVRLPEAKSLIQKAMTLAPGDPFIVDSMGWVEFRMGNRDEALRFAARFAAKEAFIKCLGSARGIRWHEIELLNDRAGKPVFRFSESIRKILEGKKIRKVHVSISHTAEYAVAFVVFEPGRDKGENPAERN